jgi:peptidoglycan hydrolase-like protein with peptidoglycan-binding domain
MARTMAEMADAGGEGVEVIPAESTAQTAREESGEQARQASAADQPDRQRGRLPWWVLGGTAVVLAVGGWFAFAGESGTDPAEAAAEERTFVEVVQTDLVQESSFDGTLGTLEGDPITTQLAGTVTGLATEGAQVTQGEVLFSVDVEPVILLYGETPAHRDLSTGDQSRAVVSRVEGTVSEIAEVGATLQQGDVLFSVDNEVLFAVDNEPVVLLYGDAPMYRTLDNGSEDGPDVEQLERALVELGYDPDGTITVDEEFTFFTAQMVKRWQKDIGADDDGVVDLGEVVFLPGPAHVKETAIQPSALINDGAVVMTVSTGVSMSGEDVRQLEEALVALGYNAEGGLVADGVFDDFTRQAVIDWQAASGLEPDGVVNLGEVVFAPGPVQISEQLVTPGSPISGGVSVLAVSSTEKAVRMDLPAEDQGTVDVGDQVTVVLPDLSEVAATVVSVATTATVNVEEEAVFEVVIELDDASLAGRLDEAPVTVDVVSDSVEDVLAVPVTALVALREGGYAVEVDAGGGPTRLVAVDPGFFGQGLVEVTSSDLEPGDRVVVP